MKTPVQLLLRTALLAAVAGLLFVGVLSLADGNTDAYYLRFTTPQQHSLVLGTSRAAQGLRPQVINEVLGSDFYNYSFTLGQSPYGPTYLGSIKAKLDTSRTDGRFLLAVDPYSISADRLAPNDSLAFPERERCLGNTLNVTSKPNFTYLKNNLGGRYYQILMPKLKVVTLQDDGWLEVGVDMSSEAVAKRRKGKVAEYRNGIVRQTTFSAVRYASLRATIRYLSEYGKVYLVRLPVHPEMAVVDEEMDLAFRQRMADLAREADGYLDMFPLNDRYVYTDGNHIALASAAEVSAYVATWIREIEAQ